VDGLFKVPAGNFVELSELDGVALEPVCETPVKVSAGFLGEGVVGGIADEKVSKAKRLISLEG